MAESPRWYFREFLPGDNVSDPDFTKSLFSSEGDAPLSRSLIREGLQNSLDARRPGEPGVRVQIKLLTGQRAVPPSAAAPFTSDLWGHLRAETHGLEEPPEEGQPIPCLVFEDFGTHGLRGDPEHWAPRDIQRNPFFLFFRALGRSGKSDEARGRWGVGKFVFPMSSHAHVIWGLTVPSDTMTPLLMGRSVLRTHSIGSANFHPDGHWGMRLNPDTKLVSAVRDPSLVDHFREVFGIERHGEPGLSIVVPWIDPEVTLKELKASILEEYFMPLLRGELTVTLSEDGRDEVIGAEAVRAEALTARSELARKRLELAVAVADGASQRFVWPTTFAYNDTEWKPGDVAPDFCEELRSVLEAGSPVTVELQVTIRPRTGTVSQAMLKVHLLAAEGIGAVRPLLVRDGISVSEEKTKTVHDFVVLLTADGDPLATMIGDAETPAHERLQHELLKNKYILPKKMLTFVREAASSLLRSVWAKDEGDDPLALAAYFPVVEGVGKAKQRPSPSKPGPEPEPKPVVPGTPKRYNVRRVDGGFRVAGRAESEMFPDQLSVAVAYDVRRGNPFKKYRAFDFNLSAPDIRIEATGCDIVAAEGNRLVVKPHGPGFDVAVTGFDVERDLVVRVDAQGGDE